MFWVGGVISLCYRICMTYIPLLSIKNILDSTGKYWIVFTGDSITSCEWVHPNWRDIVIYVLQQEMISMYDGDWKIPEWGIKGFNFAYDGSTTTDIANRIDNLLLVKPNLVIGLMGSNDPRNGVSVEKTVENVSNVVNQLNKNGVNVVWCNSTSAASGSKKNIEYKPYAEAIMKLPENENFHKIDIFNMYQAFPTDRFFTFKTSEGLPEGSAEIRDDEHPNQLGNAYIAKIILKEVFGIKFDPERYISETLAGEKFPGY